MGRRVDTWEASRGARRPRLSEGGRRRPGTWLLSPDHHVHGSATSHRLGDTAALSNETRERDDMITRRQFTAGALTAMACSKYEALAGAQEAVKPINSTIDDVLIGVQ